MHYKWEQIVEESVRDEMRESFGEKATFPTPEREKTHAPTPTHTHTHTEIYTQDTQT